MKLISKYNHKSLLFWCYLAAQRINETACAVAYYLSAKGRHMEFNSFKLAKIEILFWIPYISL